MGNLNQIITNIKCAFITLLGDKYIERIIEVFKNIGIYEYETIEEAEEISNNYFNNGKKYRYSPIAIGGGITEEDYYIDSNGELRQKFIILISKGNIDDKKIQILVHELCHVLSTFGSFYVEEDKLYVKSGVSTAIYEFDGKNKGNIISEHNSLYNEIVTENLATQVMDIYNNSIEHHAVAYQGAAEDFRPLFRNENLNSLIIEDYMNHSVSNNFINELDNQIPQELYQNVLKTASTNYDLSNEIIREYFAQLYELPVSAFFQQFIEFFNRFSPPKNIDRDSFKIIKRINRYIIRELGNELVLNQSYPSL